MWDIFCLLRQLHAPSHPQVTSLPMMFLRLAVHPKLLAQPSVTCPFTPWTVSKMIFHFSSYVSVTNPSVRFLFFLAVSLLAGDPAGALGSQNGYGTWSRFDNPKGIAIDSTNTIFISQQGNRRLRKIESSGTIVESVHLIEFNFFLLNVWLFYCMC